MNLENKDLSQLTKLISQQIQHVTCAVCCKYYIVPETASCGHTLCHICWRGRLKCAYCAKPIERRSLKLNGLIQNLTENVHVLGETFEKLFNIKVAEFLMEVESVNDSTKNVRDWLASSQNHFSGPDLSCEQSIQEMAHLNPLNISSNKIQIHANTSKTISPKKVVHAANIPQDDWDKIEPMPDTEDIRKNKENVVGPMDIEPFYLDEDEYTIDNPRRSSRKKEHMLDDKNKTTNRSLEKQKCKDSIEEIEKKSNKSKQHWINVKKMRKEFSKLNKKNRSKLNVSIEMCKKTQNTMKIIDVLPQAGTLNYDIDENTPDNLCDVEISKDHNINGGSTNSKALSHSNINLIANNKNESTSTPDSNQRHMQDYNNSKSKNDVTQKMNVETVHFSDHKANQSHMQDHKNYKSKNDDTLKINVDTMHSSEHEATNAHVNSTNTVKLPFYKRSALHPMSIKRNAIETTNAIKTTHHNVIVDSNTNVNDDIEITIKVANTIANIVIKRKNNMEFKINTDREIQTSLDEHDTNEKNDSSKNTVAQNIVINVSENNEVQVNHRAINNPRGKQLNKVISDKTESEKKNTDSADTATAHFEITESVEKELSKIMEFEDVEMAFQSKSGEKELPKVMEFENVGMPIQSKSVEKELSNVINFEDVDMPNQTKSAPTICSENPLKDIKTQKTTAQHGELEYLNDLDIFDSESVKEPEVQLLKNSAHAPSEILLSTIKTKNKTQKFTEKRRKSTSDEEILPEPKKVKINHGNSESKQNQTESDSMNYDAIMGTAFANIDADLENLRSQNIIKNTYPIIDNYKESQPENHSIIHKNKDSQEVGLAKSLNISHSHQLITECDRQKDSENVFSISEKDDDSERAPVAPTNKKMLLNVPSSNLEEFLTPVMSQAANNDEIVDDSDKSVVEETPQKTSFTKKQKSNGANKEGNQSQMLDLSTNITVTSKKISLDLTSKNSIVNLTDTSEIKSDVNETAIKTVDKKSAETPLTINKFVDQIQHNSTPLSRKSLNFESEVVDDLTLCATNDVAKTTQEKEFMIKAFEKTPTAVKSQGLRNFALKHKKYIIAGSCLTAVEIANLRKLCVRNRWTFEDKYTKDLTHLVVGVDEENKAQRSVKYMCALASSKWIISYKWVEMSIQSKDLVNETPYEVLDSTGHPGPMRSRMASKKLFQGILFFCMEPFSILDVDTLKSMIESAGGRVVEDAKAVQMTDKTSAPAILLAEPENTQEDRFIYLAMQLSIVPVNYEWVLNCLGSYTLASIQELLLCPFALLPKATEKWPQELLTRDEDDE